METAAFSFFELLFHSFFTRVQNEEVFEGNKMATS
jgi:hypothetical protein